MIPRGSLIDNYAFDSSGSARIVALCSFMATLRLADSCTPKGGRSGRGIGRLPRGADVEDAGHVDEVADRGESTATIRVPLQDMGTEG